MINVSGLSLNTLCLQYVDASFYQVLFIFLLFIDYLFIYLFSFQSNFNFKENNSSKVARSLILPFTVILSSIILKKKTTVVESICCGIVCLGFLTGVGGEINVSYLGVFFGVTSSFTTAIHAVVITHSLDVVNQNTLDLVYYNNVLTAIGLIPVVFLSGEIGTFYQFFLHNDGFIPQFLIGVIVAV